MQKFKKNMKICLIGSSKIYIWDEDFPFLTMLALYPYYFFLFELY